MGERTAVVLTTPHGAATRTSGATLRADEVVALLVRAGYAVERAVAGRSVTRKRYDLAVAVSYACAGSVREMQQLASRTWLDVVDSWLLVNGSGLRSGMPSYAVRAARDAVRLSGMPAPDVVTWISAADRAHDGRTVRGQRRLVLPGTTTPAPRVRPRPGKGSRLVLAGDWDYPPNRAGLRWLVVRVLPRLLELHPARDWHVALYGVSSRPLPRAPRLLEHGYVEDAGTLYAEGDIHLAPVRFGGGVKRKVLLPLLAGLPVVTTRAGAHGLRPVPLLTAHEGADDFAAAVAARLAAPATAHPLPPEALHDGDDTAALLQWLLA